MTATATEQTSRQRASRRTVLRSPLDGIPNLAYDNTTNRITTTGFQYDVNGNMIRSLAEDGVTWVKYEYDAANRLNIIRKDDAGQTQLERFQYDHTNARVQSHDPATDQYKTYVNAGGTTLAEFTETTINVPTWTKSYTHMGGSQLATVTPNGSGETVEFNHPDRLGTKARTNQSTGTSTEQAHLPFGRPLDAETSPPMAGNNKRFTSYDRSGVTKLDYAVNRSYDSKLGRFTQVDPIGMEAVSLIDPQTLNMYAYCVNDPVNYVDPSGLFLGSFFRWLGRLFGRLLHSRVARRIAIKFVTNFALSGGNFGVAIRSVIPDILQSTGIFPDPRSTVPWYPGSRLPISLGTSSLSRYIIYNFLYAGRSNLPDYVKRFYAPYTAKLARCIWKVFGKDANLLPHQSIKNAPDVISVRGMRTLAKGVDNPPNAESRHFGQSHYGDHRIGRNGAVRIANDIKTSSIASGEHLQQRTFAHELGNKLKWDVVDKGGGSHIANSVVTGVGGATDSDTGAHLEACIFGNMAP